jgi:hypothetical protein
MITKQAWIINSTIGLENVGQYNSRFGSIVTSHLDGLTAIGLLSVD